MVALYIAIYRGNTSFVKFVGIINHLQKSILDVKPLLVITVVIELVVSTEVVVVSTEVVIELVVSTAVIIELVVSTAVTTPISYRARFRLINVIYI